MKKTTRLWQLFGFAQSSLLGTLLHFLYEWIPSPVTAVFSGVNESTFEHMKLLFWPMLAFAIAQGFFFKGRSGFWNIKLRSTLLGLILIPIIFYTYNGVIGKSPDWINITIFFVAAAAAYAYEARLFSRDTPYTVPQKYAFLCFVVIALTFAVFTFRTPALEIFRDPLTGDFGIPKEALK